MEFAMDILIHFAVKTITFLFFAGMAGSTIVVLLSFVEDMYELMGD